MSIHSVWWHLHLREYTKVRHITGDRYGLFSTWCIGKDHVILRQNILLKFLTGTSCTRKLSGCNFHGRVPQEIYELIELEYLYVFPVFSVVSCKFVTLLEKGLKASYVSFLYWLVLGFISSLHTFWESWNFIPRRNLVMELRDTVGAAGTCRTTHIFRWTRMLNTSQACKSNQDVLRSRLCVRSFSDAKFVVNIYSSCDQLIFWIL